MFVVQTTVFNSARCNGQRLICLQYEYHYIDNFNHQYIINKSYYSDALQLYIGEVTNDRKGNGLQFENWSTFSSSVNALCMT